MGGRSLLTDFSRSLRPSLERTLGCKDQEPRWRCREPASPRWPIWRGCAEKQKTKAPPRPPVTAHPRLPPLWEQRLVGTCFENQGCGCPDPTQQPCLQGRWALLLRSRACFRCWGSKAACCLRVHGHTSPRPLHTHTLGATLPASSCTLTYQLLTAKAAPELAQEGPSTVGPLHRGLSLPTASLLPLPVPAMRGWPLPGRSGPCFLCPLLRGLSGHRPRQHFLVERYPNRSS